MFNKFGGRFAYEAQGGDWEGWTPPWLRHERHWHHHRGPRAVMMRRRGPFGPGGPFGPKGPFGPGGPFGPEGPFGSEGPAGMARRFFGRGDVKFALLELLQERPMHGYEMMKALEEKSGGFYVPSAGTIYPTLQMLEDRGLVTVAEAEGKKVYSITDAGRAALNERAKNEEGFEGPGWAWRGGHGRQRWNAPEIQALRSEAMEVARLFAIAGRTAIDNPEQLTRLRSVIEQARKELNDIIYGTSTQQSSGSESSDSNPTA